MKGTLALAFLTLGLSCYSNALKGGGGPHHLRLVVSSFFCILRMCWSLDQLLLRHADYVKLSISVVFAVN